MLPFTVTRTYLASVAGKVYFSEFSVVPLLSPLNVGKCSSISGCGYDEMIRTCISVIPCNVYAADVLSRTQVSTNPLPNS